MTPGERMFVVLVVKPQVALDKTNLGRHARLVTGGDSMMFKHPIIGVLCVYNDYGAALADAGGDPSVVMEIRAKTEVRA